MTERKLVITNRAGIHARPAALLVKAAINFKSSLEYVMDGDRINGKSIMGILTMGASYGTELTLVADGEDEAEAVEAISRLFESKFEEE